MRQEPAPAAVARKGSRSGEASARRLFRSLGQVGLALAAIGALLWCGRLLQVAGIEYREFSQPVAAQAMPDPIEIASDPGASPHREAVSEAVTETGWELPGEGHQRALRVPSRNGALIVFVHGSPGEATSLWPEAQALARRGFGALLLDLPGYGASAGDRRWGEEFDRSVEEAIEFAERQPDVDSGRIGLFGYSMGTAVAARVAARDDRVRSLVLLAPFTSLEDDLRSTFRGRLPGKGLAAVLAARAWGVDVDALQPLQALSRLGRRPLLLVFGGLDTRSERVRAGLTRVAPGARVFVAKTIAHVGFERAGATYFDTLQSFWEQSLVRDSGAPGALQRRG